jgi:PAS domain-containing protein
LKDHTREALEAEIKRLRTLLEQAGTNAEQQTWPDLPQPAAGMMTKATSANGPAHVQGPAGETATSSGARVSNDARRPAVFHNLDELAIILTDPAGIVTDWNAGAERVMGWRAEEIIGQSIERIFTATDRATHRPNRKWTIPCIRGA